MQKLIFPYEWLDDYDKLTHVRPVAYRAFYSSLKGGSAITLKEYDHFIREFSKQGCTMAILLQTRDALCQRAICLEELCNQVMRGELFGFLQVDIHVPDYSKERFSEFCLCSSWIPFLKKQYPGT